MPETDIENANILVHIGCHKTASSWLQRAVLDNPETGFCALHMPEVKDKPPYQRLKSVSARILLKDASKRYLGPFHAPKPAFDRTFSGQKLSSDYIHVLSDERLSGNPHSGGFDRITNCRKLKSVLPNARILMVFRAQNTMIRSCYHQYIVAGGSLSLAGYLRMEYNGIVPTFSLDYFRYEQLLQLYIDHFGAQNVLALPYEMLVQSPESFLHQINKFAGNRAQNASIDFAGKVNARANPWLLVKLRWLNRLARQMDFFRVSDKRRSVAHRIAHAPLARHLKTTALVRHQTKRELAFIEKEIAGVYGDANRTLAQLTGIDLARYGYQYAG